MKISRPALENFKLALFISGILLTNFACAKTEITNSDNRTAVNSNAAASSNSPKDNVEELSNLIKISETPEEAVWREEDDNNGKGKKLTAVLKFTSENAGKIAASAEKLKPAAAVQIGTEDWYPEEVTAQSQLSGDEMIKGVAYPANDFYNPPYQNGRLIRVADTDYFILELTTN